MEKHWYERSFRRNLVDMHIDDWDPVFLSQFDPQAYYDCLLAAHIQTPMIYTHSHVGLCNWDSVSGQVHRAFAGENKVRRLFDLCHQGGMTVVAYYSLIFNNWAYEHHPQWRMRDQRGLGSRDPGSRRSGAGLRYGLVCPNNPDYRAFLHAQLRELTQAYDFEGLFLDMTYWPQVCYCDSCRARFMKENGLELPAKVDWDDPIWMTFQQSRQRWMGDFALYCTDVVKSLNPKITVEHQFSTICHDWRYGVDYRVNEANDYAGGDLYGGFLQQSYISKIFMEATRNPPFEYMTSRCDPRLNVHTTTKTLYDLKLHNYMTLAHHGAFLVIDAIDPVGTLDPRVYRRIGQVFEASMGYEPFLKGKMVSEAALVMSYESKYDDEAPAAEDGKASTAHPQLAAQLGAADALKSMRMLYTVLPGNLVERVEDKDLVMVTDAPTLTNQTLDALERYVRNGGNLYISGCTDPRLARRLLGLHFKGFTQESQTYAAPTILGQPYFAPGYTAKYPLNYAGRQMLVETPLQHPVLAQICLPYTLPSDPERFASIHSNPPGEITGYPAAILAQVDKGRVLWLSFCPEKDSAADPRQVTKNLIACLHSPRLLSTDAHPVLEPTLFEDEESYTLHLVNVQQEPPLPLPAFTVSLNLPAKIASVELLPDLTCVDFHYRQNQLVLELPSPGMFTMLRLNKKAPDAD